MHILVSNFFFIFLTAQRPAEAELPMDKPPPDDFQDFSAYRVVELRKMVTRAVMTDGNIFIYSRV